MVKTPTPQVHWNLLAERFTHAVLAGDETDARRQVIRLRRTNVPLRELITRLIAPAARATGEGWSAGTVSVAEEHRASEILTRLLGELNPRVPGRRRGTAVVATPQDEHHTLPTTMAAVALREERWTVEHLGSGVPARGLLQFVEAVRPMVAVLSVTVTDLAESTHTLAHSIERLGVPVLVGGQGRTLDELCASAAAIAGR